MTEPMRGDPILGRHLFRCDAQAAPLRWQRDTELASALRDAAVAVAPWIAFEELAVTLGAIDEYGMAESGNTELVLAASPERWPAGAAVALTGIVDAIRVAVPRGAQLGDTAQFLCDTGFLRTARIAPAAPLAELPTVWLQGTSLMEVRLRGRIDGLAYVELQLGTSLHGVADPRDPTLAVDGASLAHWRAANRAVIDAIAQALAAAGFSAQR